MADPNRTKSTPIKRGEARKMTRQRRKAVFLDALRGWSTIKDACVTAGVGRRTVYTWRENDPDFAASWDEVADELLESAERELFRRAVEGWNEPKFHDGAICGHIRKFSDTCLIFFLKANNPDKYRERQSIEHTGAMTTTIALPDDFPDESPEDQE